jgi:hypothetical protein
MFAVADGLRSSSVQMLKAIEGGIWPEGLAEGFWEEPVEEPALLCWFVDEGSGFMMW